ncbi:MAG: cytochrome c oxidase subunit II [Gemmatimonadaceae bacterium]
MLAASLAACADRYPNTIFTSHTEFNRDIGHLFNILFFFGTIVFVLVEALLIVTLIRYRKREGSPEPKAVHGNTRLEILWTVIPALILVFIAIPTVETIFRTQAKAKPEALHVQVVGHQWWWEFRYPQYTTPSATIPGKLDTLVTANELYMPVGRTVNFQLDTKDVIHSFWIPRLGGKRDLVANHTNWLWFTPDSVGSEAWNGACVEYCGASHANMKFRAYTVTATEFDQWAQHAMSAAVGSAPAPATGAAGSIAAASIAPLPGADPVAPAAQGTATPAGFVSFPVEKLPAHFVPKTPIPAGLAVTVAGDPARGRQLFSQGQGACIGCHTVRGVPTAMGVIGPNLTHLGSRHTIGAGLYPNDAQHLTAWIRNARAMKPGVLMPTLGKGQYDPIAKTTLQAGLDDQQIADIAAWLLTLK